MEKRQLVQEKEEVQFWRVLRALSKVTFLKFYAEYKFVGSNKFSVPILPEWLTVLSLRPLCLQA